MDKTYILLECPKGHGEAEENADARGYCEEGIDHKQNCYCGRRLQGFGSKAKNFNDAQAWKILRQVPASGN